MSKHYLCGVDFEHELDHTLDYFESVDLLKRQQPCWRTCGIVEVELDELGEIVNHRWIEPQKAKL
jgi:hypothetical protein